MAVNWAGLLAIGLFYMIVLGIWASRNEEKKLTGRQSEIAMVGGRNLNVVVGIFTMTATWVGGGYILGTAETVYDPTKGLLWAFGLVAFPLNLVVGARWYQASEKSIVVVIRVSVVLCGVVGALLATTTSSVVQFWIISADLLYSIMTPHVICTLFLSRWVNNYGACFGYVLGFLLRVLVGEPIIGLPSLLPLPWDKISGDGHRHHVIPFRTAIVLITFATILTVSKLVLWLSKNTTQDGNKQAEHHNLGPVQTKVNEQEPLRDDGDRTFESGC